MNFLQLSGPHLLANPAASLAGQRPWRALRTGPRPALDQRPGGGLSRRTPAGGIRQRLLRWHRPESN